MASDYPAASYPIICDGTDTPVAILQAAYDVIATDQLITSSTGQEVLDFNIPYNDINRPAIVNERLIKANNSRYRVRTAWDGWDQGSKTPITSVHCEALWYADLGEATPRPCVATTATAAMTQALAGTGWTVGTINPTSGTISVTDFTNPLALVRMLPDAFGGELVFDSVNKIVHLVTRRGSATPVALFARGKNLAGNSRSIDTTNLITRLYPVGGDTVDPVTGSPLTVNLRTVNSGLDYIEDFSYYDANGLTRKTRTAVVTADTITDPAKLLTWAQAQLAMLAQPAYTYGVQQTNTGVNDATPVLGDTVRVHDSTLAMDVLARVETRTINLTQPQKTVYTVGTAAYNMSNLNIQSTDPVVVDSTTAVPAAPLTPTITTGYATATSGNSMMAVFLSWAVVTANLDGTPAHIQSYRIRWQAGGAAYQVLEVPSTQLSAMLGVIQPGLLVGASIAAVSFAGVQSAWTSAGSTTVTTTATTPATPSTPTLDVTSAPGVLIVSWDGKNSTGGAMLPNFLRTEVHVSTTNGFTPTAATRVDSLHGAGRVAVGSVVYGTPYYVKLITLNTDLIAGSVSTQATATPRQTNTNDISDLNVGKITSGIITAASIQLAGGRLSTSALSTGARLEFDGAGIRAYNSGGVQLVNIDAATGSITGTGTIQTAIGASDGGLIKAVVITSAAQDRVTFYSGAGTAEVTAGYIQNFISGGVGGMSLVGPQMFAGVAAPFITLGGYSPAGGGSAQVAIRLGTPTVSWTGGVNFFCNAFLDLTNTDGSTYVQSSTGTGVGDKIGLWGTTFGIGIAASTIALYCGASGHVSVIDGSPSAPRSSGATFRPILASAFTVSSRRDSKTNIKPMKPGEGLALVSQLRPVTARSNNDGNLPASMRDRYFLVAEEVAQVSHRLTGHVPTEDWFSRHGHKEKQPAMKMSDLQVYGNDIAAFVPVFTQALQDLHAMVLELKTTVEATK